MPIYEYECTACRVRFERSQRVYDAPVETCPECGATTRRVFHPVGIIFKGSGFYVTDNRKPSTTSTSSTASKSDGDNDKSDKSDKSDTGVTSDSSQQSTKSEAGETAGTKSGAS